MRSIRGPKLKKMAENLIFRMNYINYAYLINYAWPLTMAGMVENTITVTVCNFKAIIHTNHQKMVKNNVFGSFYANYAYLINYA